MVITVISHFEWLCQGVNLCMGGKNSSILTRKTSVVAGRIKAADRLIGLRWDLWINKVIEQDDRMESSTVMH